MVVRGHCDGDSAFLYLFLVVGFLIISEVLEQALISFVALSFLVEDAF